MARIDRDPSDRARNARTEQLPLSFLFVAEKNVPVVDLAVDIEHAHDAQATLASLAVPGDVDARGGQDVE